MKNKGKGCIGSKLLTHSDIGPRFFCLKEESIRLIVKDYRPQKTVRPLNKVEVFCLGLLAGIIITSCIICHAYGG